MSVGALQPVQTSAQEPVFRSDCDKNKYAVDGTFATIQFIVISILTT